MKVTSAYKKGGMFEGANHLIFEFAKQLRKEMTESEKILWVHLKSGIKNCKFRRQHPIGNYIADFFCYKLKLIIEVDGSIHDLEEVKINDDEKEKYLIGLGYKILRFTNKQVYNDLEFILNEINFFAKEANQITLSNEKKSSF
ncbi:MAG: endonuclease domain-containing protein [Ginsengibacter sp.]